jgi:hypothetical protein
MLPVPVLRDRWQKFLSYEEEKIGTRPEFLKPPHTL